MTQYAQNQTKRVQNWPFRDGAVHGVVEITKGQNKGKYELFYRNGVKDKPDVYYDGTGYKWELNQYLRETGLINR